MIAELLDATEVRAVRDRYIEYLNDLIQGQWVDPENLPKLQATAQQLRTLRDELLMEKAADADITSSQTMAAGAYIPSARLTCILQSHLEDVYRRKHLVVSDDPARQLAGTEIPITDERLAVQKTQGLGVNTMEDGDDIRYVVDGMAAILDRLFAGEAEFNLNAAKPADLGESSRVLLLGDWATGVPRARNLAQTIADELVAPSPRIKPRQHLVHLGDTYYAGRPSEYKARFLPYWPKTADALATQWSLNGNHDMYSGGVGYFGTLLTDPIFESHRDRNGKVSSYFILQNDHWQIFGLDSAYYSPQVLGMDGAINDAQADFVATNIDGNKGVILLTHHQLFSARPKEGHSRQIMQMLEQRGVWPKVTAWLWGHEHRCTVFNSGWTRKHYGLEFAMCMGNSGVPRTMDDSHFDKDAVAWEYRETLQSGTRHFMNFAFASLTFDDQNADTVAVTIFDPYGHDVHTTSFCRRKN